MLSTQSPAWVSSLSLTWSRISFCVRVTSTSSRSTRMARFALQQQFYIIMSYLIVSYIAKIKGVQYKGWNNYFVKIRSSFEKEGTGICNSEFVSHYFIVWCQLWLDKLWFKIMTFTCTANQIMFNKLKYKNNV